MEPNPTNVIGTKGWSCRLSSEGAKGLFQGLTSGWVLLIVVPVCPPEFSGMRDEGGKAAPDRARLVELGCHALHDHLLAPLSGRIRWKQLTRG